MKPNPVRKYRTPAYPTRLEALADPALLREHLPAAWRLKPELAGAIAILLAANACVNSSDKGTPPSAKAAIVAPIFEHGGGRATAGCMVSAPPVFLSEEEALLVITDELTSAGLKVTASNVPLEGVKIRRREITYSEVNGVEKQKVREVSWTGKPLVVDIEDNGHRVAAEFVSVKDYFDLGGTNSHSSVQDYNLKVAAQSVAKSVGKSGHGVYFAAFYDPVTDIDMGRLPSPNPPSETGVARNGDASTSQTQAALADRQKAWDKAWKEARAAATAESRELLRQQVKDFVDWLKGQGVI